MHAFDRDIYYPFSKYLQCVWFTAFLQFSMQWGRQTLGQVVTLSGDELHEEVQGAMGTSNGRNQSKEPGKVPGRGGGLSGDLKVDMCVVQWETLWEGGG